MKNYPRTRSNFSSDPELLTPTESRHTTCLLRGKSPSVKLMSRRENKELAKTNLKNMDKTMQNQSLISGCYVILTSPKEGETAVYGIAVFCLQNLICLLFIFADQVFIDPTFFGIFVCGPLQSLVVNVCTNWGNIFGNYFYLSISCLTVLYMAFFFAKLAGTLFMIHTYIHTYTHTLY